MRPDAGQSSSYHTPGDGPTATTNDLVSLPRAGRLASLTAFESLAFLFTPVDQTINCPIIEADEAWRLQRLSLDANVAVWGRRPSNIETRGSDAMLFALRRELSLKRLSFESRRRRTVVRITRLPPPRWDAGLLRYIARKALLSGALVELGSGDQATRVIDAVAHAAGAPGGEIVGFRPSLEGVAQARLPVAGRRLALLRIARTGHSMDPGRALMGLSELSSAGVPAVPRPLGGGQTNGASWTLESLLSGRRPRKLTDRLMDEGIRFCSTLPRRADPPTSITDRLTLIGKTCLPWQPVIKRIQERLRPTIESTPAVMQHGDFWSGNLLVEKSTLAGVVDWDFWHPAGVPGADVLHCFIAEQEHRTRRHFGDIWLDRPWRSGAFLTASSSYWNAYGIRPLPRLLELSAIDCWANRVASHIIRSNFDPMGEWMSLNVDHVLAALDREEHAG